MRFIKAEIEEKANTQRKDLKKEFEAFMNMNVKSVKVIYTKREYACATAASGSFRSYIKRNALPVKVLMRNGNVYLIRTDL